MSDQEVPSESTELDEPATGASEAPGEHSLYVVWSADRSIVGQRIPLSIETPLLIGRRVERGGVSIDDSRMSRVHARVAWDARCRTFRIADLESANGVWTRGSRQRVVALTPRTAVRLGSTLFAFTARDVMGELAERTRLVASSPFTVSIRGETGTGKEHLAHALHERSGREGAFVPVNCSAFSRELLAAELFGHTKNAFSGATNERAGLFRAAHRGTLFLDEIGDMPLDLQPALLRVLQERTVRPVGSDREVSVDVRVVAATHQDLDRLVEEGLFRSDLRARLSQVELVVPPLRERAHTLPALVRALATRLAIEVEVTLEAMTALVEHEWRDNVRELENLLTRLKLFGSKPLCLDSAFLKREAPALLTATEPAPADDEKPETASMIPAGFGRSELLQALETHGGRVSDVARELATSRTQVYRWLKRWGIALPSERKP